jgi:hypothetical protein
MQRSMIVTDVTRMQRPAVCVAGFFADDGAAVRPVMPYRSGKRITENFIWSGVELVVFPFAEVRLDFRNQISDPPHTEDWELDPRCRPELVRVLPTEERRDFLEDHVDGSVAEIFGAPIQEDQYIKKGEGERSLGTVLAKRIWRVGYEVRRYKDGEEKWDYRIWFTDHGGQQYGPAVTDLTFRTACDYLSTQKEWDPEKIGGWMTKFLRDHNVYLRIGLARGWERHPDRCYLQVTGVYSFPDYLGGKTLSDLL